MIFMWSGLFFVCLLMVLAYLCEPLNIISKTTLFMFLIPLFFLSYFCLLNFKIHNRVENKEDKPIKLEKRIEYFDSNKGH